MKNIKLYEEFTGNIIPDESVLANQIAEFLDITADFQKSRGSNRALSAYVNLSGGKYSNDKLTGLIKLLKDNNYKIETSVDEMTLKAMILSSRIDYSDPLKHMDYGMTILVDCKYKGEISKACINITSKSFTYEILGKWMEMIETKKFDERNIDMLFWNGKYLVTGKFEQTDRYIDDGIITLTFDSYETSDNKDYIMSVNAIGSPETGGYELEDIVEIDFH
jgi:hypothetical protein